AALAALERTEIAASTSRRCHLVGELGCEAPGTHDATLCHRSPSAPLKARAARDAIFCTCDLPLTPAGPIGVSSWDEANREPCSPGGDGRPGVGNHRSRRVRVRGGGG